MVRGRLDWTRWVHRWTHFPLHVLILDSMYRFRILFEIIYVVMFIKSCHSLNDLIIIHAGYIMDSCCYICDQNFKMHEHAHLDCKLFSLFDLHNNDSMYVFLLAFRTRRILLVTPNFPDFSDTGQLIRITKNYLKITETVHFTNTAR